MSAGVTIDWESVAARIAVKVDECCGCHWEKSLAPHELNAVELAISELKREEK